MAWIKTTDRLPPENEQVLVHDNRKNRIELGRYAGGRWYVEDVREGRLSEVAGVTHWAWILDSQTNDDDD
jgi:hypothetical protein